MRDTRPHWREFVERLGVPELPAGYGGGQLEVAGGDVVGDGVAEDVLCVVGGGDVFAVAPDYYGEFAFVVELGLAGEGDGDGFEGGGEGVGGLGEDCGVGGDGELWFEISSMLCWLVVCVWEGLTLHSSACCL